MPQPAVDDMNFFYALLKGLKAAFDLGDHASGYRAIGDEPPGLGCGERMHQAFRIVYIAEHAGNVAQNNQFFSPKSGCNRGGCRIGIDVEFFAVAAHRHRGNHGHLSGVREIVDCEAVDACDFANVA